MTGTTSHANICTKSIGSSRKINSVLYLPKRTWNISSRPANQTSQTYSAWMRLTKEFGLLSDSVTSFLVLTSSHVRFSRKDSNRTTILRIGQWNHLFTKFAERMLGNRYEWTQKVWLSRLSTDVRESNSSDQVISYSTESQQNLTDSLKKSYHPRTLQGNLFLLDKEDWEFFT